MTKKKAKVSVQAEQPEVPGIRVSELKKHGEPVENAYGKNQDRVLSFLQANKDKAFNQRQIAKFLGYDREQVVNNAILKLAKKGKVGRMTKKEGNKKVIYNWAL